MTRHTNITIRDLLEATDVNLRRAERKVHASPEDVDAWKELFKATKRAGRNLSIALHYSQPITGVIAPGEPFEEPRNSHRVPSKTDSFLEYDHGYISLKYYVRGLYKHEDLFTID